MKSKRFKAVTHRRSALAVHDERATCGVCAGLGSVVDHKATGKKVRSARKQAGLSMAKLGQRMGISEGYMSDLELGKRHWDGELIDRAEAALR